jgi:hypothetical protein
LFPTKTTTTRVVITFTDEAGAPQVTLARLHAPGDFLRYWVEDSQPLAHLRLGHRLHDVECTRATPNDPDFGTQTWRVMRVAKNELHSGGDHILVLAPLDEAAPSE